MLKLQLHNLVRDGLGLCVHADGTVKVCATANQDNPLMPGMDVEEHRYLGIDVWEHAYYLELPKQTP